MKKDKRTRNIIWLIVCTAAILGVGAAYIYHFSDEPLVPAGALLLLLLGMLLSRCLRPFERKADAGEWENRYREELFDALSSHVDDLFLVLDHDGVTVNYVSENVERLFGVPREKVLRDIHWLENTIADGSRLISAEEFAVLGRGQRISREREYIHWKTGEHRWYRETLYRMHVREIDMFVVVIADYTRESRMNEELRNALELAETANEAKSSFLSAMSHDIRTPMNAIIGFATLLNKDAEDPEQVREYTKKISASGQHLLSLINDVLDMSKIEGGKTSLNIGEFSVPDFLEELGLIALSQAKAKHQSFEIQVKGKVPEFLLGDRMRLTQVLLNLISNSIKYTPDSGRIELMVYHIETTEAGFAHLRFVVRDNGTGITEEQMTSIFDPFVPGDVADRNQSTELELAITKNVIDLMGGSIDVQSQPGEGTTCVIELELAMPQQKRDEKFWERHGVSRILVVDDEEDICLSIRHLMEDTGVLVEYTTDGYAAIDKVVEMHAEGIDYDVVLLDWKMPRLHGVEAAHRIRTELGEKALILILTGYEWNDIEKEAKAAGVDSFVPKPFFASNLQQKIELLREGDMVKEGEDTGRASSEARGVLEGKLFLVAEDIELNAELISAMLSVEGAKCEIAENGQKALEMFRNSDPGYYDFVLMDVQMPVLNGYEATKAIRRCGHPDAEKIPVIAMTANVFQDDVQNALDAGMNAHVAKPVDMDVIKQTIQTLQAQG